MPNLKDLKNRIGSVKNTQKITKAMKMVAASKLRRAQERAEAARPYSSKMERMLSSLANMIDPENAPILLTGRQDASGKLIEKKHLIVVVSSDRGLCGSLNSGVVKAVRQKINENKTFQDTKLVTIGKKGNEQLEYGYSNAIVHYINTAGKKQPEYSDAQKAAEQVIHLFETGEIDTCSIVYNEFLSVLSQKVKFQSLIPLEIEAPEAATNDNDPQAVYEYEPGEEAILSALLPTNIAVQIYHAMLENAASEHGARMTAMDNATRNAGEMIKGLTLVYNRTRQAAITKELIEIISGAEAI